MKPGDNVEYLLVQGIHQRWIPAVVIRVGPKRVTIRDIPYGMTRYVKSLNLRFPQEVANVQRQDSDHPDVASTEQPSDSGESQSDDQPDGTGSSGQ